MKKSAVIFPGQGSQYVGMGAGLSGSDVYIQTMNTANSVLGFDLSKLCADGPIEELTRTENSQAAIFTLSYIAYTLVKESMGNGWRPDYLAGLSLGEFSALAASGAIGFEDCLRLVYKRGKFMMKACEDNAGAMASIMGAERSAVHALCLSEASKGKVVGIANLNCPGQIVVSGDKDAVAVVAGEAESAGYKVVILNVSGAFHSKLMESARVKLAEEVKNIKFSNPEVPLITNADAVPKTDGEAIKESIIKQMVSPVLWEDIVNYMLSNGVEAFIEPGCGKVLKGLLKRIDRKAVCVSVESLQDISEVNSLFLHEIGR